MMEREAFAWAIKAPAWASPPFFICEWTVRPSRAEAQAIVGDARKRDGETQRRGWRRAYRDGWRAIRVCITPALHESEEVVG